MAAYLRVFSIAALLTLYSSGGDRDWLDGVKISAAETTVASASATDTVLTDFDQPFLFTYLGFEQGVSCQDGTAVIRTKDGKGGAAVKLERDLSAFADCSPAIFVRLGPSNKASQVKLQLIDGNKGKVLLTYELSGASTKDFRRLLPADAECLASPGFDASNIKELHVQGNWRADRIDIEMDRIELVAPTPEMLAVRKAAAERAKLAAERRRQQEEKQRLARERLLSDGAAHAEDGPQVVHVCAAGDDLLGIEIQAGTIRPSAPVRYERSDGDIHEPADNMVLAWWEGRPALVPAGNVLLRKLTEKGRPKKIGQLNLYANTVWSQSREGAELEISIVDDPRAYRVSVDGQRPVPPVAVYRKSKPNGIAIVSGEVAAQHFVYLKLSEPIRENAKYVIQFFAVNTREAEVNYVHRSRKSRCEALHVSHLGYRQDDPLKRAYLSLWTGTGGGQAFAANQFQLLNDDGDVVYTGPVRLGKSADEDEPFANQRNHTQAHVYHLDFSDFHRAGSYVVHVPGLGVSYPFKISDSAWKDAFRISMHGFLAHRSGIELGPPATGYVRPRNMHPDDGFVVFKSDATIWDGESDAIQASLKRLMGEQLDPSKLERHPAAWGGYMDAGDWDRRSQHLLCSYRHLELIELFPDYFGRLRLSLPPDEAANRIPDVLDEALWNLDLYRRLQEADGGVGGGIESTAHPRPAEASWQESLLVGAFRPDPETTYRYAAVAAKAARLLDDDPGADEFGDSAQRAWRWAEANAAAEIQAAIQRKAKKAASIQKAVRDMKALAAIELFRLTGDAAYHDAFLDADRAVLNDADIAMGYALIPAEDAHGECRDRAKSTIIDAADAALQFSTQNGFNIALAVRTLPMMGYTSIWSTPGGTLPPVLPRAHFLTGEQRYLAGSIAACQYSGGANPMNMSFTTGIGPRQPLTPLHIDHRVSGQLPPAGITVYGQSDPAMGYSFDSFAHTWYLNRYGGVHSTKWPTAEAYIDLGTWPAMNEYTVHQTLSPTSYTWGYLAAREPL